MKSEEKNKDLSICKFQISILWCSILPGLECAVQDVLSSVHDGPARAAGREVSQLGGEEGRVLLLLVIPAV